jgi:ERF superfamily
MTQELATRQPSGMELLAELSRKVNDPQAAIEIAKQIVELETRWEGLRQSRDRFDWEKLEREAKVAFAEAFKAFKDDAPKILKTKHVFFESKKADTAPTSYWHVELDKACDLLIPALLKVGITHRWKSTDLPGGMTRVTCYLRHQLGYEEEGASLAGPADQSGGKNPIQGVGSSTSYLERYTFLATCGIVAAGKDNDGTEVNGITQGESDTLITAINEALEPVAVMGAWTVAIEAAKKFTPVDYRAMTILTAARDERLKELRKAK